MNKVIFWDFDGTLVCPDSKWSASLHKVLKRFGYDIDFGKVREHMRTGYTWHRHEDSYVTNTGQKWWDNLFKHFTPFYESNKISQADEEKMNTDFRQCILNAELYTLYEDAEEVLRKCIEMGYTNYILSNNFPELSLVIEGLEVSKYFADYVVSANIGYEKPRIELFQYALKLADSPEICYMVGDNPVADIQGGKSAGMTTILVHKDGDFEADFKCDSLSEIPPLLAGCNSNQGILKEV